MIPAPEEIKVKIAKGELRARAAFGDYFSALAYRVNMESMIRTLEEKLNELK